MEQEQKSVASLIRDAGIIIALVTVSAYFLALSYESGFCSYFSIPYYLISLNPTIVLSSIFLPVLIVSFVSVFTIVGIIVSETRKRVFIALLFMVPLFILNLILQRDFEEHKTLFIVLIVILGLFEITLFWPFLMRKRACSTFWYEPVIYAATAPETTRIANPHSHLRIPLIVCILAFFGISIFRIAGSFEAQWKDWFHVIKESAPEVAIIRAYGDYLYGINFNRTTKNFERQVVILKMPQAENHRLTLISEKVGPLQPKSEVKY